MPRTIRVYYSKAKGLRGRCRMNFNWEPITRDSVVLISAAEATDIPEQAFDPSKRFDFNLGSADIYVTNIGPHQGGVEFILHVNWSEALNVVVDISVFPKAEQFFVA